MATVFLSSTGRDLSEYREAVFAAISPLDGFNCTRMEDFGARPQSPLAVCLSQLAQCDVFVGIVGHYHGSSPPNEQRSFTEIEYEAAIKIDRLMFLAARDLPLSVQLRESEEKWQRQKCFQDRIQTECQVAYFSSPEDLAKHVVIALANWERKRPKLSVNIAPGEYMVIVKSPLACKAENILIPSTSGADLRPNPGERHVLWAVFVPLAGPTPTVLDFRNGRLPKEVRFVRGSTATYKPRRGDSWVPAKPSEPRFEEVTSGEIALVLEPTSTNLFLDSSKPNSRSLDLSPGHYTLWIEGSGQLEMSRGARGFVREGKPLSFHLDRPCDVFISVSGEVERVQLETGDYATSYIETTTLPTARAADGVMSLDPDVAESYFRFMRQE